MTLTRISETVVIEDGPRRIEAYATPEVLDDKVTHEKYQVGALDCWSKVIVPGQKFTYVDWYAPVDEYVHNVYQYSSDTGRFERIGEPYETLEEATEAAKALCETV